MRQGSPTESSVFRFLVSVAFLIFALSSSGWADNVVRVVGHKNPDTDAIVSAIALAELKTKLGIPASPRAQGKPNPETQYLLDRFGFPAPEIEPSLIGKRIILVDHSDYDQAPDDLRSARLAGIIDHHKLGGIQSDEPIEVIVKPVGSTATIIFGLFEQAGTKPDPKLAGLLLGAVLSDTRLFRSPTTTAEDRSAAEALARTANIQDVESLGRNLLEAYNAQMKSMSDEDLVSMDSKLFRMGSSRVLIGQVEAFDIRFLETRLSGIRDAMASLIKRKKADAFILALTDVDRQGSRLVVVGAKASRAETALGIPPGSMEGAWKDGVMSRKLQLVPVVQKAFSKTD